MIWSQLNNKHSFLVTFLDLVWKKKSEQSNLHPVYTHVWISEVYSLRDKCSRWSITYVWTYPLFTVVDDFALIMAKVTEVYLIPVSSMCHQWEQFSSTWSSETWWWEHNSPAHLGGKANQIKSGLMQYTKMGNDCWWSSDMEWNQAGSMRL